jgi:endo-1,4-beta-xylanase
VSDGHSWLNNWPVKGRTNHALLFDRQLRAKRSWQSVIQAAQPRVGKSGGSAAPKLAGPR